MTRDLLAFKACAVKVYSESQFWYSWGSSQAKVAFTTRVNNGWTAPQIYGINSSRATVSREFCKRIHNNIVSSTALTLRLFAGGNTPKK